MAHIERKLGINADCLRKSGISTCDTLMLAHQAGFSSFFNNFNCANANNVTELKTLGDRLGMDYEFIHAPYRGINAMWEEGDGYTEIYNAMIATVDAASANGVPAVITHVSSGWTAPPVNDLGISRFDALVEYAAKKNVIIALENLRMVGNLTCLGDRYEGNPHVRFCYDCGHENCYTNPVSWIEYFRDRLLCTHIHDNAGRPFGDKSFDPDTHWLPLDGTMDYKSMMEKLDRYEYRGSLMLEVFNGMRPEYNAMAPEAFIAECYRRIKQISQM